MQGPIAIVPVTAVPTVVPTDASLAASVFSPEGGNAVEIFGLCHANSGALTLYRNLGPDTSTEWHPVSNDKADAGAVLVDHTLPAEAPGYFSKAWSTSDLFHGGTAQYVVLYSGAASDFAAPGRLYAAARRMKAP